MTANQPLGSSSIQFSHPVYFVSSASVVGEKEGEGPLAPYFDHISSSPMFGCDTWEEGESAMQKAAAMTAIQKAGLTPDKIRMAFAGDLLAQGMVSAFGTASLKIPFYGLYSACSTIGEALSLGAITIAGGCGDPILCAASSHFASAEKEFRYPLGYGCQRPLSATWTVTGSGAFLLSSSAPKSTDQNSVLCKDQGYAVITGVTTGRFMDYGLKDSMNMGGCMAPAAADTISRHLADFGHAPNEYDKIITGDLGEVGKEILCKLLSEQGISIEEQHDDCGLMIYDNEKQDTHSGGSGCGCAATVLASYLLPKVVSGEWKRILFLPTGALLSKVSFNEGDTIPGISHAVMIEHFEKNKENNHTIL